MSELYTPPESPVEFNFQSGSTYTPPHRTQVHFNFIGPIRGNAEADSTATGDLNTSILMGGDAVADSTATGKLYIDPNIFGDAVADSTATGSLSADLSGDAVADSTATGSLADGTPGSPPPIITYQGFLFPGLMQPIHHKVHLKVQTFDAAEFLYSDDITFEVWNSYPTAVVLTRIEKLGDETLSLIGPADRPANLFAPFESRVYTIRRAVRSREVFNTIYRFNFVGIHYELRVTLKGRVPNICTLAPDYETPLTERREWLTNVLANFDATEQRVGLRGFARCVVNYRATLFNQSQTIMQNLLYGSVSSRMVMPIWSIELKLTAEITLGDVTLPVVTTGLSIAQGQSVMLRASPLVYQVFRVVSSTASSITVQHPVRQNWPRGASVYPVGAGTISTPVPVERIQANLAKCTVTVSIDTDTVDCAAADAYPVYRSMTVLEHPINWDGGVPVQFKRKSVTLDPGIGVPLIGMEGKATTTKRNCQVFLNTPDRVLKFKAWVSYRQGRLRPFWMPSDSPDFVMTEAIGTTNTWITVKRCGYTEMVAQGYGLRDIRIQLHTGYTQYKRIVNSQIVNQDTERLYLDFETRNVPSGYQATSGVLGSWVRLFQYSEPTYQWLPVTSTLANIRMVSYIVPVRAEQDGVDILHRGEGFAVAQFNVEGIITDV